MRTELHVSSGLIFSFLLVLARVAGSMIYVPLPGFRNTPEPVRAFLILALTMTLYPFWPTIPADPSFAQYTGWLLVEAAFGLCVGLLVGFLSDAALLFGQICGTQAGFSFASTIDPETQADSPVLSTIAQTVAGLLFVTLGLHRYVIRLFAESLQFQPPAMLTLHLNWSTLMIHTAGSLFSVGLRLALPVVAMMTLVDLTLALLGRINAHLQLLSLAMPLKMLAAIATISVLLMLFPAVYTHYAEQLFQVAAKLVR
jgi:flagellar biosynthesis protein FliR